MVIIAVKSGSVLSSEIQNALVSAIGSIKNDSNCITTTTTTSTSSSTTTTTTTLIP